MATSIDAFKRGVDNLMEIKSIMAVSHEGWIKHPCPETVCLSISFIGGNNSVGRLLPLYPVCMASWAFDLCGI